MVLVLLAVGQSKHAYNFFVTCFNSAFPPLSPSATQSQSNPNEEMFCTEDEVFHLQTLDITKASGSDRISSKVQKYTAATITPMITKLSNFFMLSGKLPLQWKQAQVVPIPKTTDATSLTCYCPISLTLNLRYLKDISVT